MNAKTYPMNRKQTGFTLTELMITLAVAAILLSQAVPSFLTMLQDNRIVTQANDFVTSLNVARSEAVKRGDRVTICKSANNTSCAGGGDWQQGWIIFTDSNSDATVNNTDEILRTHGSLDSNLTLSGVIGSVTSYVSYTNNGSSQIVGGGGAQTGTIVLCDSRGFGDKARAIVINASGQIRTAPANDATVSATSC